MNRRMLFFAILAVILPLGCGGGSPTQPSTYVPPSATQISLSFEYIRTAVTEESERTSPIRMYFVHNGRGIPNEAPLACVLNPSTDFTHFTCPVKFDFPAHFECGKTGQANEHMVAVLDAARLRRRDDGSYINGSAQVATRIVINGSHSVRVHQDGEKEIGLFKMDTCGNIQ